MFPSEILKKYFPNCVYVIPFLSFLLYNWGNNPTTHTLSFLLLVNAPTTFYFHRFLNFLCHFLSLPESIENIFLVIPFHKIAQTLKKLWIWQRNTQLKISNFGISGSSHNFVICVAVITSKNVEISKNGQKNIQLLKSSLKWGIEAGLMSYVLSFFPSFLFLMYLAFLFISSLLAG